MPPAPPTTPPVAPYPPPGESPGREPATPDRPQPLLPPSLSILGQLRNTFILCETPEGLVIVDQHTAHERVLFDRLQAQLTDGGVRQQALLLPETFTPTPSERVALEELRPCLGDLGLDLEPFGSAFVVNAIPSGLDVPRATEFLRDLLREYADRPVSKDEDPRRRFLDLMACRAAVKAGDAMNEAEQEELVSRVFGTASAFTCPHGRPILLEWRYEMLEKAFKRH